MRRKLTLLIVTGSGSGLHELVTCWLLAYEVEKTYKQTLSRVVQQRS